MKKAPAVKLGIDRVLEPEFAPLFGGRRLGVVSACSGLSSSYRFPIDILNENYTVSAIFAPEHGPRGVLGPGEKVGGGVDRITGLEVRSLYEDIIRPKAAAGTPDPGSRSYSPVDGSLSDVDVMVFDMQDAGSRYFTYVSTMYCCMRACAEAGIPFCVLDRPNPLGGDVEGNVLDPAFSSFIGLTEVPIRHGMTTGELARFYNGKYKLGCELYVVPMSGWTRDMYFDDTGLPFVRPSPNLPTFESVLVYNGTCLFEGTNVSVGRGTTLPFTMIGAGYIDPVRLADRLNADETLEGVRFSPAFFRAEYSKLTGVPLYGVTIHVTDKRALRAVRLGVTMMRDIEEMYPEFEYTPPKNPAARFHIDLAAGGSELRTSGKSADELIKKWDAEAAVFAKENERYRLYD
ncbi:MAG: DUF1343 domain-containing protein [Clostridia bacterium]|nr:DUF1343 domain-containing protein [Clostridia bacterium]